eukprot:CAMPEP_0201711748 /NCGR_PEP_ID=MMETSP0578-20130828/59299_1 /ASSEMBLY_ACC=CAM_ASM_000663 /TAXON_ID=267565 /ORGANISM="Skeletonema grethea, Strain CCMP 1804" /LENGTH=598 /DNA_ID=CAMNT_0048200805 /DNA_START=111 /DNA_END=1904 /DNA_ORIENTATION=-
MVTSVRTRLSRLTQSEEGALLSPVPEDAEAKLPASDGVNGSGESGGDENEPCESGGAEAIETFITRAKCEGEESVTEIADDAVVNPHQIQSVYGDVLSHLIALPFEAQSMLKFHQRKESSTSKDGRRKRKKSSRNAIPIYSQKQYLRGAGLMSLSTIELAEKETKKKRKVKSSPSRGLVSHSNRSECAEFSPRSVKTLESPKRGVPQSPRQQNATTNGNLNSNLNQSIAALQEQALAQTQQQQLFINEHRNIASLHQEHELQLLLQQRQQQQQSAYYDPLQSVHHHLYHQMLMTSYPYNPYLPYQQPGYQQISPQLLQPLLHGGYMNNPDEVLIAALKAAEAANQNDPLPLPSNGFAAHPNSNDVAALQTEAANQNSHLPLTSNDFVSTAAPPAGHHNTVTANLLAQTKAGAVATATAAIITSVATCSKQNLTMSNKQDVTALPQAIEQNLDSDDGQVKKTIQDEDATSKMKPKKAAARPKKVVKRKKQTKAPIEESEVKNDSKSAQTSGENRRKQNGNNRISVSDEVDFPPGWTTSTQPRKTGRGFNVHYVSPTNNIFRSRKNAIAFIAILKELKKKNSGEDPSEEEALALFDRRGH